MSQTTEKANESGTMSIKDRALAILKALFGHPVPFAACLIGVGWTLVAVTPPEEALHTIGTTILGAGAFTAMTKALTYGGIFEDVVVGVLKSRLFEQRVADAINSEAVSQRLSDTLQRLEERFDHEAAWLKRTNTILADRVAHPGHVQSVTRRLGSRLGVPLSDESRGYYRRMNVIYSIRWHDRQNGAIVIDVHQTVELVPRDPGEAIELHYWWEGEHAEFDATQFTVDGEKVAPKELSRVDQRVKREVRKMLVGRDQYEIVRQTKQCENIFKEPWLHVSFARHVIDLEVLVTNDADGLTVNLLPIGDLGFKNHLKPTDDSRRAAFNMKNVIPEEGFVLIFAHGTRGTATTSIPPAFGAPPSSAG